MAHEGGQTEPEVKDAIVSCIGEFGKWQLMMTFLLSLVQIPCTFHIYSLTFISAEPDVICANPVGSRLNQEQWSKLSLMNGNLDKCSMKDLDYTLNFEELMMVHTNLTKPCSNWHYDIEHFGSTIVSEWDLVCDRNQLRNVAEMMFLLGVAIGGLMCGYVSDRFGRKKTLMVSLLVQILLGISISFTPSLSLFLVLRCALGFFCVSVVGSALVLCIELVGGKWFIICGILYVFPVPLSYIFISGLAYLIKNWRILQLVITSPAIFLLPLYWILPESPRWLLIMSEKEKVMDVLRLASDFNGKKLPENADKIIQDSMRKIGENPPKVKVLDLYRTSYLRRLSLVMFISWFCIVLVYFGLVLNLSYLGGDIYISSLISGAVEFPSLAFTLAILLKGKMCRRWPLSLASAIAGIFCLLAAFADKGSKTQLTFAMIGRLFITSSNHVISPYTAQLFPIYIRNLGLGSLNIPTGIALIMVPYIWNMAGIYESLPLIVLGLCGLTAGLAVWLLPEAGVLTEKTCEEK